MVLVLVVHQLEAVTATIPMCVILLKDLYVKKEIPDGFRLRQVVPTSGEISTSLWDVLDPALFEEWLRESLGPDVIHTLHPVVEEVSVGIMATVGQARTSERAKQQFTNLKVSTKSAVSKAGNQLSDFDKKYGISENTSQTFKKMSDAATQAKDRAFENPTFARMSTNVNAGLKSVGKGFGWARDRLAESISGSQMQPTQPVNAPPPSVQQASRPGGGNAVFDLGGEDDEKQENQ